MRIAAGIGGLWLIWAGSGMAATPPLRADVEAFVADVAARHPFDAAALRRLFGQVRFRPAVVRAMAAPGTARPWHEFRARHVDAARIQAGMRFWERHAATLERAGREFGVPPEIVVATLGIETLYGRTLGSFRVVEALSALAFDYPPRAGFFRAELEEFLLLSHEAGLDALETRGSYAGAMGLPQFLPSSYRRYAIDFDGDGRRHLWGEADAIGSIAHYYHAFGWRPGEPVAVPAEAQGSDIDAVLGAGIQPHSRVGELRHRGIVPLSVVSDDAEAALFAVEDVDGRRYWLGLQNFYVITRYNRSVNYAMAVYELAGALRARREPDPAFRR